MHTEGLYSFRSKFGPWTKSQAGLAQVGKLLGTMQEYTMGSKAKQVFVKQNRQAMMQ